MWVINRRRTKSAISPFHHTGSSLLFELISFSRFSRNIVSEIAKMKLTIPKNAFHKIFRFSIHRIKFLMYLQVCCFLVKWITGINFVKSSPCIQQYLPNMINVATPLFQKTTTDIHFKRCMLFNKRMENRMIEKYSLKWNKICFSATNAMTN